VLARLPDWAFFEALNGTLTRLGDGAMPRAGVHSLWGRPLSSQPWLLELMLDRGECGHWVYRRHPDIARPFATAIRRTAEGLPYLAPEIQLLYKARPVRPRDQADFDRIAPLLSCEAQAWLRQALALAEPGHRWLPLLERMQAG
jgi:hypothetical protein